MSVLRTPALVIFDLDGTLVDSAADLRSALNGALTDCGYAAASLEDVRRWVGTGADKLIGSALQAQGVDVERERPRVQARYFAHYDRVFARESRLFPGVREALEALKAAGIATAVCTNKVERYVRPLLAALGVEAYFDRVAGGDTYPEKKPQPEPLLRLARALSLSPAQALMVGDSIYDVQAARAAGMPVVAYTGGYNHGEPIADARPDGLLQSLAELPALIGLPAQAG